MRLKALSVLCGALLTLPSAVNSAETVSSADEALASPLPQAAAEHQLTDQEKLYGLSLFWKEVSYNFAYFDQVPELDFDQEFQDAIPKVLATKNTFDYYRELQRLNALLNDGHTNVYLPNGLAKRYIDWPAIDIKEAGKKAIVSEVGVQWLGQLPLGSEITHVNGIETQSYVELHIKPYIASSTDHIRWDQAFRRMLHGEPGSLVTLDYVTPLGEERQLTLKRDDRQKKRKRSKLPLPSSNNERLEFTWLSEEIAYLALNSFSESQLIDDFGSLYDELSQSKGLVIDLRFNNGGNSGTASKILAHFTHDDLKGAKWKTRQHVAAYKSWGNHVKQYRPFVNNEAWVEGEMSPIRAIYSNAHIVPTMVLVSRNTASAAEDFLIYADPLQHFTLVGEPTYGSTGNPLFVALPGGGSFRVCTKRDSYPDGREFVGYGVLPDIHVERTPTMLMTPEDEVLNVAINLLEKQLTIVEDPIEQAEKEVHRIETLIQPPEALRTPEYDSPIPLDDDQSAASAKKNQTSPVKKTQGIAEIKPYVPESEESESEDKSDSKAKIHLAPKKAASSVIIEASTLEKGQAKIKPALSISEAIKPYKPLEKEPIDDKSDEKETELQTLNQLQEAKSHPFKSPAAAPKRESPIAPETTSPVTTSPAQNTENNSASSENDSKAGESNSKTSENYGASAETNTSTDSVTPEKKEKKVQKPTSTKTQPSDDQEGSKSKEVTRTETQ